MRHRFVVGIIFSLLLMIGVFLASYQVSERRVSYIGPASLDLKNNTLTYISFHSSGWTLLNLTCNGQGLLFVNDQLYNRTIFQKRVNSHSTMIIVIPHEGTYAIFTNGSMFCSGYSIGIYPTSRIQNVLLALFGVLSFVSAFFLWRWWR